MLTFLAVVLPEVTLGITKWKASVATLLLNCKNVGLFPYIFSVMCPKKTSIRRAEAENAPLTVIEADCCVDLDCIVDPDCENHYSLCLAQLQHT